jgi:hypothetical protein
MQAGFKATEEWQNLLNLLQETVIPESGRGLPMTPATFGLLAGKFTPRQILEGAEGLPAGLGGAGGLNALVTQSRLAAPADPRTELLSGLAGLLQTPAPGGGTLADLAGIYESLPKEGGIAIDPLTGGGPEQIRGRFAFLDELRRPARNGRDLGGAFAPDIARADAGRPVTPETARLTFEQRERIRLNIEAQGQQFSDNFRYERDLSKPRVTDDQGRNLGFPYYPSYSSLQKQALALGIDPATIRYDLEMTTPYQGTRQIVPDPNAPGGFRFETRFGGDNEDAPSPRGALVGRAGKRSKADQNRALFATAVEQVQSRTSRSGFASITEMTEDLLGDDRPVGSRAGQYPVTQLVGDTRILPPPNARGLTDYLGDLSGKTARLNRRAAAVPLPEGVQGPVLPPPYGQLGAGAMEDYLDLRDAWKLISAPGRPKEQLTEEEARTRLDAERRAGRVAPSNFGLRLNTGEELEISVETLSAPSTNGILKTLQLSLQLLQIPHQAGFRSITLQV